MTDSGPEANIMPPYVYGVNLLAGLATITIAASPMFVALFLPFGTLQLALVAIGFTTGLAGLYVAVRRMMLLRMDAMRVHA